MNSYQREISYQISKKTFNAMLENRTEAEKKENPYSFVMRILNQENGLRGNIKAISII